MARYLDKKKAITLRKKGLSYSAIKEQLGISKSTLSYWLADMPLSQEEINQLRAHSPRRIERFRLTMQKKREAREYDAFRLISNRLGEFTGREIFISGLFLYWGEGGKTKRYSITFSNTDPDMIRFYLVWLQSLGVQLKSIKVRLHLYSDMNVKNETSYWCTVTKIRESQFQKPYIKKSLAQNITHRGYRHGTCNVIVDNRDISDLVMQGLKYLKQKF